MRATRCTLVKDLVKELTLKEVIFNQALWRDSVF